MLSFHLKIILLHHMLYLKINTFALFINASAPNCDIMRFKHYCIDSAFHFGEIANDRNISRKNDNKIHQ